MRSEAINTIFDYLHFTHHRVKEIYQALEKEEEKERVRMLLDYLHKHEETLEVVLESYRKNVPAEAESMPFAVEPCSGKIEALRVMGRLKERTVDEILFKALDVDECLIALYEKLASESKNTDVRAVYKDMADRMRREKKIMVRDVGLLRDL